MVEIEIFLNVDECQVSFLSIPSSDIERLAVFPFWWMCYVISNICEAHDVLSTIPNGPPVDYDRTEFVDTKIKYYYQPLGRLSFCVWDLVLLTAWLRANEPSYFWAAWELYCTSCLIIAWLLELMALMPKIELKFSLPSLMFYVLYMFAHLLMSWQGSLFTWVIM